MNPTEEATSKRPIPTSTRGRGKAITLTSKPSDSQYINSKVNAFLGDSLDHYGKWPRPTVIVSDGGYGVLGFEGDTSDHLELPRWYEPHIEAWAQAALPCTTLWFWNSEIGWAAVHPVLEKYGWRYVNANVWNKGLGHIAGNVNTKKIRRFPVVTEVCVQYSIETRVQGATLKDWLRSEWARTGLPFRLANEACGVRDAATRKYLARDHLWYMPPPDVFAKLVSYANTHGAPEGRPYFCIEAGKPGTGEQWSGMRYKFHCPHGKTNVWERGPLHGAERIRVNGQSGRAVHLNQKPLDLMSLTIEAASDPGDVIWEPFGGLFTGCVAAIRTDRVAYSCEKDSTYFQYGVQRLKSEVDVSDFLRGTGVLTGAP